MTKVLKDMKNESRSSLGEEGFGNCKVLRWKYSRLTHRTMRRSLGLGQCKQDSCRR